jgi:VWFA-related protein
MTRFRTGRIFAGLAAGAALAVWMAPSSVAAPQEQEEPTTTLRVTTEVVDVYAVVRRGNKGPLVPNLSQEDFEVKEDGKPQEIRYFARETDTPLTLAILVDTSISQERVLGIQQREAKRFLQEALREKDLTCVLQFDMEVELIQDFTQDQRLLARAIDATQIRAPASGPLPSPLPTAGIGGTHLYDAVYLAAVDMMRDQAGRKVIILLSDGVDQGSQVELDAAIEAAQKSNVIVYSIDVADPDYYYRYGVYAGGGSTLKRLSEQTGGRVIRVDKPEKTAQAFQEVAEELRTQYLLGYSPTNSARDGGYRKIEVKVRKSGGYKVQARRGYYAPRDEEGAAHERSWP